RDNQQGDLPHRPRAADRRGAVDQGGGVGRGTRLSVAAVEGNGPPKAWAAHSSRREKLNRVKRMWSGKNCGSGERVPSINQELVSRLPRCLATRGRRRNDIE